MASRIKTKSKLIIAVAFVLGLAMFAGVLVFLTPNFNRSETPLYIYPGDTKEAVLNRFKEDNRVMYPLVLKATMNAMIPSDTLPVGRYEISPTMSSYDLVKNIKQRHQLPVKLVFNNVRTPEQLAGRLSHQLLLDSTALETAFYDSPFLEDYNVAPQTLLTLFIPNTYEIYWTVGVKGLFDRMQKEYDKFWTDERRAKANAAGLSLQEVAILASIVEEETNRANEKPIVAGLYLNRLRRGMLLQADPTAKFASGDFGLTQINYGHTAIDSPYNTYKYAGLPPGPIRMPSISGIDAVLNYTPSDYIFMCAKETLNGEHYFTASYAEHERNAAKYHKALRAWNQRQAVN